MQFILVLEHRIFSAASQKLLKTTGQLMGKAKNNLTAYVNFSRMSPKLRQTFQNEL